MHKDAKGDAEINSRIESTTRPGTTRLYVKDIEQNNVSLQHDIQTDINLRV